MQSIGVNDGVNWLVIPPANLTVLASAIGVWP
jgi:hypothetical protein